MITTTRTNEELRAVAAETPAEHLRLQARNMAYSMGIDVYVFGGKVHQFTGELPAGAEKVVAPPGSKMTPHESVQSGTAGKSS